MKEANKKLTPDMEKFTREITIQKIVMGTGKMQYHALTWLAQIERGIADPSFEQVREAWTKNPEAALGPLWKQ